ncbi:MAG: rhodanese-like domain-containing protein [Limnohabitans sp.]|nr:rhodanese-like domain-containing protein [Limnohabitans sp.]
MNFLVENWILVFVALTSGIALLLPNLQAMGAPGISPTQAVLMINREKANVVDLRSAEEFAAGHLIGARHVAMENIPSDLTKTVSDKKRPLILVCASGFRSQKAQRIAQQLGYENVHSLGGGLRIWQEANLPLEKA